MIASIISFISNNLPALFLVLILGVFGIGVLSILYHLLRFGIGLITKVVALLLLASSFIAVGAVLYFYNQVSFQDIFSLITGSFRF